MTPNANGKSINHNLFQDLGTCFGVTESENPQEWMSFKWEPTIQQGRTFRVGGTMAPDKLCGNSMRGRGGELRGLRDNLHVHA